MTVFTFDEATVSDLHKDARGWRPREYFWADWNEASDEQKQVIWDGLCRELTFEMECEKAQKERALRAFEARINVAINHGAKTMEDAVRWVLQAEDFSEFDLQYGADYVAFCFGLDYDHPYKAEVKLVIEELLKEMEINED